MCCRALDFSAADIARQALEDMCARMDEKMDNAKPSRFGRFFDKPKKNAKLEATNAMRDAVAHDFTELSLLVESKEHEWKSGQGRVGTLSIRILNSFPANHDSRLIKISCGFVEILTPIKRFWEYSHNKIHMRAFSAGASP